MFDYVINAFHFLKDHPDVAAAMIGISISIMATQFFKKLLPDSLSDHAYRVCVQLIGFLTGWVFTHGAWILLDPSSSHFEKVYASAGCGFASPAIYSFVAGYLGAKFPWFNKMFSGRPSDNG